MKIIFVGTNGWFCSETGETICTLIETEDYYIILDAGNGIRKTENIIKSDKPVYLFLSHFHLDHTVGLHSLEMLKLKNLTIFTQQGTKKILETLIDHPFTIPYSELPFPVELKELKEGLNNVPFPVICRSLTHADPVFGYRFELEGKSITYCTDTGVCENFKKLAKGVDLLISECACLPGQETKWLHMNPEKAARLAREFDVKKLILTHFDAIHYRTLAQRKEAEKIAKKIFPNTTAATDGLQIEL